jgi:hypothetical protein
MKTRCCEEENGCKDSRRADVYPTRAEYSSKSPILFLPGLALATHPLSFLIPTGHHFPLMLRKTSGKQEETSSLSERNMKRPFVMILLAWSENKNASLLYLKRSAAYLSLGQNEKALRDSIRHLTLCVRVSVKGLYRAARAL